MARKPDPNAPPPGGWETPAIDGKLDPRPAIRRVDGTRMVRGKLTWNWKDLPAVRVRTRVAPGCK